MFKSKQDNINNNNNIQYKTIIITKTMTELLMTYNAGWLGDR